MKVKFLINPTGKFNLSYNAGEIVEMDSKQCELLLEAGAIEIVEEEAVQRVHDDVEFEIEYHDISLRPSPMFLDCTYTPEFLIACSCSHVSITTCLHTFWNHRSTTSPSVSVGFIM